MSTRTRVSAADRKNAEIVLKSIKKPVKSSKLSKERIRSAVRAVISARKSGKTNQ